MPVRRNLIVCIAMTLGVCAWTDAAPAVTYYVRATGNDTNAGTSAGAAFRTIQKAVNMTTAAGTTIYVGPGAYNEQVQIGVGTGTAAASGTAPSPMRLVADTTGANTGDAAGAVTIAGGATRAYGIDIESRNYWRFDGFSISGQTSMPVYAYNDTALWMTNCKISVGTDWGAYLYVNADSVVSGNEFVRTAGSGHSLWIIGMANGTYTITGNRVQLKGSLYKSTAFRTGGMGTGSGSSSYAYGIIYQSNSNASYTVYMQNNLVSDAYIGIYCYDYSNGSKIYMSNNTVTNCLYSMYVYTTANNTTVNNNIIVDSYYGLYGYSSTASVEGILQYNIAYPQYTLGVTYKRNVGNVNPLFKDPPNGDFSLNSGSPARDAGALGGAPATDIMGRARPQDDNGDGVATNDLGAWEGGSTTATIKVTRWREVGQDE